MAYQLTLSNSVYQSIVALYEARLVYFKNNIAAYVELSIEYEAVLKELAAAELLPDPKPEKKQNKVPVNSRIKTHLCETHQTYRGIRIPRGDCEECWKAYEKLNGKEITKRKKAQLTRRKNSE